MRKIRRFFVGMLVIVTLIFELQGITVIAQTVTIQKVREKVAIINKEKINDSKIENKKIPKKEKVIELAKTDELAIQKVSKSKMARLNDLTSEDGIYTYQLIGENAIITGYKGMDEVITIPDEIDGYLVTGLVSCSFAGTVVTSVTIPKTISTAGPVGANGPFAGANYLKEIVFEEGMKTIPEHICACGNTYTSNIVKIVLPESIEKIGRYAFFNCGNLDSIDIPKGVSSIGEGAFSECKNLSEVTLHYNSELKDDATKPFSLEIHDRAFSGCGNMESITLTENVTYIGASVFSGTGIRRIMIPKSVVECGYSDSNAGPLSGASKLNEVIFENGIKEIPAYFCSTASTVRNNITSVTLPESIGKIGSYAFLNCINLVSVDIPKGVSSIGEGAFLGCKFLSSVTLHFNSEMVEDGNNGTKLFSLEICAQVFSGCEKLKNIRLTENVSYIGYSAFSGTDITNIMIPKSVTHCSWNSGRGPLSGASKLEEVEFENGIKDIPAYFCQSINIHQFTSFLEFFRN